MQHTHAHVALSALRQSLTQKDDLYFVAWVKVNSVLGKFWPERFSASEYLVLLFIVSRTLMFRKKAEVITKKHFAEGVTSSRSVTCSGCGVGETALKKALKRLCDEDFLHVHSFKEGNTETVPRIYELNFVKILDGYDTDEVHNMLKRGKSAVQNDAKEDEDDPFLGGLHVRGEGGRNRGYITEVLHTSNKALITNKSAEAETGGEAVLRVGKRRRTDATDCTDKPKPISGNARERLAQMQAMAAGNRAKRLHSVRGLPERRWDIKDLQALLDEARTQCGLSVPRVMATAKGAGVLFKRMKAAEINDSLEFFTWAFTHWSTVANANRRSKARQLKDTKTVNSEMSLIPNFAELAYRFPYILAFFNDRKFAEVQEEEKVERRVRADDRRHEEQQVAIERRRQLTREEDLRKRDAEQEQQTRFVERRRRPRPVVDDDEEDPVPQFREREWRG
jgi:hypothetical protein